ncbi:hypothetical protein [Ascidiimonas sp. W6]|uniref:hypothetical protein n=1 Tax=Ascidiimonas meishanensis TaxID=3128903 RepID=UPI0030EE1F8D
MKKLAIPFLAFLLLSSCDDDDTKNIDITSGTWRLVEQLADPGDGSGTFQPVRSEKTLQFLENGSVVTNKSLCDPYSEEQIASGTYSIETGIINTSCSNEFIKTIFFEVKNGALILDFISNEGFSQKYRRFP